MPIRLGRVAQLAAALPPFAIMRLVRRIVFVRLVPLHSERIGHFAANTDLYLCERDAGINVPAGRHVDLCFFNGTPIANAQLAAMWARCVRIWPAWLLTAIAHWNRLLGSSIPEVQPTQSDRDVHDLWPHSAPHLQFTREEEARGEAALRAMGIEDGTDVVCLIVRDAAYLKVHRPGGKSFGYHDYRNSDIQNYRLAAEALAERGCVVLRMGAIVEAPLLSDHPRVIDYATSSLRSEFLDVYIAKRCLFCLSTGTGYDLVPTIFRKPIGYVNFVAAGTLPSYVKDSVAVFKRFWLSAEQRWLSLSEIFDRGVGFAYHSSDYSDRGVELIENTPPEIADVALEMFDRLKGDWRPESRDESRQESFWRLFPTDAADRFKQQPLHSAIRLTYSAGFLRDHPEFLA